jgi:hypothetical protein
MCCGRRERISARPLSCLHNTCWIRASSMLDLAWVYIRLMTGRPVSASTAVRTFCSDLHDPELTQSSPQSSNPNSISTDSSSLGSSPPQSSNSQLTMSLLNNPIHRQRLENSIAQQLAGSTSHSTSSTLPSSPNNPGSSITSNAPASSSSPSSNSSYNPQMFEQQLQNQIFQQQVSFFYLHFLFLCFLFCPVDRGGLIGQMFLALDRGQPSVLPTSLLLDAARLVGGGGGSSGATGSGGQFTGLPRPRTFFVSISFLFSALHLLPPFPLSLSISICFARRP